jgi:DNA-directed RNA polymerase specialized sigma24 family protein
LATVLMLRVAQGDSAAFNQLVRLLERPALALAFRTLNDRAGAEDVCQQAFTRLWTHGPRFDPARGSAEAWFRRILVILGLDRRRAIRPVQPLDSAAVLAAARECRAIITAEEHMVNGGLGEAVAGVIAQAGIGTRFKIVGIPDEYTATGSQADIFRHYGLTMEGLAATALELLGRP